MKTRLQQGVERWNDIANVLNAIAEEPEGITVNDKRIWRGILHDWDNEDWELLLEAVGELLEGHPAFFKQYHKSAWLEATKTLVNSKDHHPRTLDQRRHKKQAWRMIMSAREVWNKVSEHYCDINDIIAHKPQPVNFFD
jgi:hypothetical protein